VRRNSFGADRLVCFLLFGLSQANERRADESGLRDNRHQTFKTVQDALTPRRRMQSRQSLLRSREPGSQGINLRAA